ncbi:hypothetical protein [Endothiovibrio diazotrophicus]
MSAPRPLDPALLAALLTTLATALLYAAGWSYAYHFYDRLNLGLIGLEIPLEYHFIYGFWALRWGWWLLIPLAIGRLAWPRHGARWTAWLRGALPLWLPLAFLGLYALGWGAARADYREHAAGGFTHYPLVRVWLKEEKGTGGAAPRLTRLTEWLREGGYRLLVEGKSRIYLVKTGGGAEPSVVVIPAGEIRAMRVVPVNPGR